MSKLSIKMNGRNIRPDQLAKELQKAAIQKGSDAIKRKVESVRCRKHRQLAKVVQRRLSPSGMNFDVSGCCEELVDEVRRRLR